MYYSIKNPDWLVIQENYKYKTDALILLLQDKYHATYVILPIFGDQQGITRCSSQL